ncbi:MAG: aspartate--tRNA ligase [Bacteroidales bacterium]|nr:aspartate--tRNA ligase [Bacteroidales bacterium]
MYRTHNCGELRIADVNKEVTLCGWVQRVRNLGGMTFTDLRDRYGITQLVFNIDTNKELCEQARKLGREFVIQAKGVVTERSSKNKDLATGEIEIIVKELNILNKSEIPPFTIEDNTDGGEDLLLKYRYLDIRRRPILKGLQLRNKMSFEVRRYLDGHSFMEVETPMLIKSTPEGARDYVVPSRIHHGEFYALPQSPQQYKQLLMVAGIDRYYQIVKCFRDEDLRADRQPEFTQIDCEMSFVEQEDVLQIFEGLAKHLFKTIRNIDMDFQFPRMVWKEAMEKYGSDKPDIRFGMTIHNITDVAKGHNFKVFDDTEYICSIAVEGAAGYTRKQIDELTEFVKRPQVGAKGLVYIKYNEDGTFKSSVDKFFNADDLKAIADKAEAKAGDLIFILCGKKLQVLNQMGVLRIEMGNRLNLRDKNKFAPLWVVDFPLFEWDDATQRFYAMHHPFTSPKKEDYDILETNPGEARANAYDLVINGIEIGGGSIRIHDSALQVRMFKLLGFTEEKAKAQFECLINAFKFGAPPHGGLAFGLDRWAALMNGSDSIKDVIAFPKNNAARDVMIDAPSAISPEQLDELSLTITPLKSNE